MRILALVPAVAGLFFRQKAANTPFPQTFATDVDACCDCFAHKQKWPGNGGLESTVAPKKVCNTCYVHDRYGIDNEAPVVTTIPSYTSASGEGGGGKGRTTHEYDETEMWVAQFGEQARCNDICGTFLECGMGWKNADGTMGGYSTGTGNANGCSELINHPGLANSEKGQKYAKQDGGLCKNLGDVCGKTCNMLTGCGGDGDAYKVDTAEVKAVHEWNWNCEEGELSKTCPNGNCQTDMNPFFDGPVNGEPKGGRGPYLLCDENAKFYCEGKQGHSFDLSFGGRPDSTIQQLDMSDDGANADPKNRRSHVSVRSLPIINMAGMTDTSR